MWRSVSPRTPGPLSGALEFFNQKPLTHSTRGIFVIVIYPELEVKTGEVCYSTEGHLPILRRRGATQKWKYSAAARRRPLGIERAPLSWERLAEVPAQIITGAKQVIEAIFEEIRRARPEPAEDDLTVLAVTWDPSALRIRG
jgi:hypothetical protein